MWNLLTILSSVCINIKFAPQHFDLFGSKKEPCFANFCHRPVLAS